jgi:uroporphyrinogen-III synthase
LPQAAGARPQLRDGLAAQGWEVDTVEVYQVVPARIDPRLLLQAAEADAICFASSSAVTSYLDQAFAAHQGQTGPGEQRGGSRAGAPPGRLVPPIVVCIGPVTASTARSRGLEVASEAAEHDLDDLVAALVEALASRQPSD